MTTPTRWVERAACAGVDPDLFFPEPGDSADGAKRICASCPVRAECEEWGSSSPNTEFGIYGGKTARRRKQDRMVKRILNRTGEFGATLAG